MLASSSRPMVSLAVLFSIAVAASAACSTESAIVSDDAGTDGSTPPPTVDGATPDALAPANDASDASPACAGGPTYPAGTTEATVTVGGKARSFRVHVPPSHKGRSPTPVVLVFHGGGGSAQQIEEQSSKMNPISDREGFVAVYPQGTGVIPTWNGGLCCGRAVEDSVDDVAFVSALLDHLESKLCTDRRRVFATGMSNGAILSHRLGCELSERIAAIAPVAGTIGVAACNPKRAVPVLQIHGSLDGHVPWQGGEGCGPSKVSFTSVPSTMEGWQQRNGCAATTTTYFEQGDGKCASYTGCRGSVVLCTVDGGGHSWPGGVLKTGVADCPADGAQSQSFLASEVIWKFFKEHPRAD